MKKLICFLLLFVCFLQFSCASKANFTPNITPLNFNASFHLDVKTTEGNNDKVYPMHENKQSIELMWQEVSGGLAFNSQIPEYVFEIKLLYTTSFVQRQAFSPKYFSSAIFELKSFDKNHELIKTELFKSVGMWNDGIGSLSGPVSISAFNWAKTTRQAIIKFGLLDILSHISNQDFIQKNDPIYTFTHFAEGAEFEFRSMDVVSVKLIDGLFTGEPTKYYNEYGASVLYLNFLMGENIDKPSTGMGNIIWKESNNKDEISNKKVLLYVAKLAYDKGWPLFPPQLKKGVSALPYRFD